MHQDLSTYLRKKSLNLGLRNVDEITSTFRRIDLAGTKT